MPNAAKMFGCVFILGGIAASHVTTRQTQAQVHPAIAGLNAVFADVFAGMGKFYLVEMCTLSCHAASCLCAGEHC
jgi:hypothetical protein